MPEPNQLLDHARFLLEEERERFGATTILPPTTQETTPVKSSSKKNILPQSAQPPSPQASWQKAETLDALNELICECQQCPLGATRTKFVFGVGNPHAKLMVIGEAPGADEDAKGEPFVGRAGQLLNKMLEAIHFKREEVFIANILKCRPPGNRDPLAAEVEQCEPYLLKQIELIKPTFILALGRISAQTLLRTTSSLTEMRATEQVYNGIRMIVTYHPAALLRNPNWKQPAWEDLQKLRALYDATVSQ